MAHFMTDSSVVAIDVGVGAREQALPPEAAGDTKKEQPQSRLGSLKVTDNAVDDSMAKERDALAERFFKKT